MTMPFLDRVNETRRLRRLLRARRPGFAVVYGRRRCGKSRLLLETLPARSGIYYVADEREAVLQRDGLATEIARLLPGFAEVRYPDWLALFNRWWQQAPPGAALAIDEFPALAAMAPELPSLLQKCLDAHRQKPVHLLLCGSSQRMMQGLVLDRTAPLYGRASEVIKLAPLPAGWIGEGLQLRDPAAAVAAYAVWGGVPRYWELARQFRSLMEAIEELALDPTGVLHQEPERLLLDELHETGQAASLLSLIGLGCHRLSEIAARLGKPATALTRPLHRLLEMDLIRREHPFGAEVKNSKRSLYRLADPFLLFWYRFVEPNRSRLAAGQSAAVARELRGRFSAHIGLVWEELARSSVPRLRLFNRAWLPAARWWGGGRSGRPLELDLVAESVDRRELLIGEVKWGGEHSSGQLLAELRRKVDDFPLAAGRRVRLALWLPAPPATARASAAADWIGPETVMAALRQ